MFVSSMLEKNISNLQPMIDKSKLSNFFENPYFLFLMEVLILTSSTQITTTQTWYNPDFEKKFLNTLYNCFSYNCTNSQTCDNNSLSLEFCISTKITRITCLIIFLSLFQKLPRSGTQLTEISSLSNGWRFQDEDISMYSG